MQMQQAIAMLSKHFATTGIHPFNPDIFTDDDYAGADVSDRPITSDPVSSTSAAPDVMTSAVPDQTAPFVIASTLADPAMMTSAVPDQTAPFVIASTLADPAMMTSAVPDQTAPFVIASTLADPARMTSAVPDQTAPFVMASTSAAPDFSSLILVPKSDRTSGASHSGRKRKAALAVIATSSPFKQQLQDVEIEKGKKQLAMQDRKRKAEEKKSNGSKKDKEIVKKKQKDKQIIEITDKPNENTNDDGTSEDDGEPLIKLTNEAPLKKVKKVNKKSQLKKKADKENESCECSVCHYIYNDSNDPLKHEDWVMCIFCQVWQHDSCAQSNGVFDEDEGCLCQKCL